MEYELKLAKDEDIDLLIQYKLNNILEYADDLSEKEIDKINIYVKNNVSKRIDNYKIIVMDNKIVGCLLVENYLDGSLLDEIYLERDYRNKGIGTSIIKGILKDNNIVYLWMYKANKVAFNLYSKLGFSVIDKTDYRYFMKFNRLEERN